MHKDFVVVLIDITTGNIALVSKRFFAFAVVEELRVNNNSSRNTYSQINNII